MKTVILCGGLGTRLSEETELRPKPMVEIGGRPILWHIMRGYAHWGFKEFVLALGYKGEQIKRYFVDYHQLQSHLTVSLGSGNVTAHDGEREDWTVDLVDTGAATQTGGRLKRLAPWLGAGTFLFTYGDGVSDADLTEGLAFHRRHGRLATVTAVRPPARFGGLVFDGDLVRDFTEKPQIGEGRINGGFFVLEPGVLHYIAGDDTWSRIVPATIQAFIRGERPVVRSDGTYVRDYFYVKDCVRAYLRLAERLEDASAQGEAFNFSNEAPLTVLELVGVVQKLMGAGHLEPDVRDVAEGEIHSQYLSAAKAREQLGWTPAFDLETGLREPIAWYRDFLGEARVG